VDVDEGDGPAELGAGEAVAEDPWAGVGAAQEWFGATAMIGARTRSAGLLPPAGVSCGNTGRAGRRQHARWWAERVRLVVDDSGLVISAYLQ
jgi:hypothetical protein